MIHDPFIFVLALVSIVVGIPVICGTLVKLAKILRGDPVNEPKSSRGGREPRMDATEETRLIQEIHRGLSRLESRLDALETIVLQSETKKAPTHHD